MSCILLILISISSVSADDVYVGVNTTTDGEGTLDNPYNNLQLAIDNTGDNANIYIRGGNYSGVGNSNLTISKNNITIQAYKNEKVSFVPYNNSTVRYMNITGNNIVLNGLNFVRGIALEYKNAIGAEVIVSGKNILVNNSAFTGGVSQGGILHATGSNVFVENSVFSGNMVNVGNGAGIWADSENLTVYNSKFISNVVRNGEGGAIYFTGNNLLVDTSTFNGNLAAGGKGGAISAHADDVKIINSVFFNQTGGSSEGAALYIESENLTVYDSKFIKNTASGANAGAIKFEGSNLNVNNSQFINNTVQAKNGGAIYSLASETAVLNNTYFESNQVWGGSGGAIYNIGKSLIINNVTATNQISTTYNGGGVIYTEGDCNITDSNFTKNYGYVGVGVVHQKNGDLYVNNTIFLGNQGWNMDAGAIMSENSTMIVNNSYFRLNTAAQKGGAIYAPDSTGIIENCYFGRNTANNGAGALHLVGDDFEIRNNVFDNTTIWSVGYIIVYGSNTLVDNCNFSDTNNNANSMGGAIAAYGDNVTITNSNMRNINSSSVGGMIYIIGNNFYMDNDTLNGSTSNYGAIFVRGNNTTINHTNISNTLMNYGAVHVKGNNFTFVNSNMYNCDDSRFGNGGGIFWSGNYFGPAMQLTGLIVDNCSFINCDGEGGVSTAVSAFGDDVSVTNSVFTNCTAPYAGALMTRGNNHTIENCSFTNNSASVYGGAMNIAGNNVTVQSCNFTNNYAKLFGGALYTIATNATIDGCIFVNNTSFEAGSIILYGGRNVNITNNIFANSTGTNYGGAIENRVKTSSKFNDTSQITVHVVDNLFENIHVNYDGGAILNYGGLYDHNLTMINCTAGRHGSDIYNLGVTGPVNLILDEKPRYLYVGENSWIPVKLVDDHGNTITVTYLTGIVSENNTHINKSFVFTQDDENATGFWMQFDNVGEYLFTPNIMQDTVLLNKGNALKIIVTDRMPVVITLPNITAYPHDRINYTFNVVNPNGLLIRNGTITIKINNDEFTIELNGTNKTAKVYQHNHVMDSEYTVEYDGNITLKNIVLYDNPGVHNVTAYYNNISDYYAVSSSNGTITILRIPTEVPIIHIDGFVRDEVTFSINVLPSVGNDKVGGNVSFYLPGALVSDFIRLNGVGPNGKILAMNKLEGYDGLVFTVKIRQNLTLKLNVPMGGTKLPIFYYGDRVFEPSIAIGYINITSMRNPTKVENVTLYVDVDELFNLTINVTSRHVVDENVVIVIFGIGTNNTREHSIPITNGSVVRPMSLSAPGVYVQNAIYVGGQSFIQSNGIVKIIVRKVNVTINVPNIEANPEDVINITVNLTDQFGRNVTKGTVKTIINGTEYNATVINGSATFKDVLIGNVECKFNFTVDYAENDYYNSANSTGNVSLTKINSTLTTVDIVGIPGANKTLNITLKDIDGNSISGVVTIRHINGSEEQINVIDGNATIILPNPGNYTINVTYHGNNRYLPSNSTIKVQVLKVNTTTNAENIILIYGDELNITADVLDELGRKVQNGTATLTVDGVDYGPFEVNDGKVIFKNIILPNPGDFTANITYYGNEYYNPSNKTIKISARLNSRIYAENVTVYVGDIINITAYIVDWMGNPIDGGFAILNIGDKIQVLLGASPDSGDYKSEVHDGKVIFEGVKLNNEGLYPGDLSYLGSGNYNPSSGLMYVNVLTKPVENSTSDNNSTLDNLSDEHSSNNGTADDEESVSDETSKEENTDDKSGSTLNTSKEFTASNSNPLNKQVTANPIFVILIVLFTVSTTLLRRKH